MPSSNAILEEQCRKARLSALRILARQRLTRAQLWARLERRGYDDDVIAFAVHTCEQDGYIDDKLFAQLYIDGKRKAVGNLRLIGDLVKRGVDREAALTCVQESPTTEGERIASALEKIFLRKKTIGYPSAARSLERLGFPSSLIYKVLREHAARYGPFAEMSVHDGD